MSFLASRAARVAAGLVVVSAFAAAPIAAQAVAPTTDATGTLTAGSLSNTAPPITPFSATLTGLTQTAHAAVGTWSVTDATGSNDGYSVTVSATAPTVGGVTAGAGTGGSITLTPRTASAASGNPAATGPVAQSPQTLGTSAATIETAAVNTGQGEWDFAADSGATKDLAVVIPGDASAGGYSSTLTFTASPLAV
jgi:hypothetical protein